VLISYLKSKKMTLIIALMLAYHFGIAWGWWIPIILFWIAKQFLYQDHIENLIENAIMRSTKDK